jgi:hypothetical protein
MAKNIVGFCKICGNKKKLSKEHIPPSAAFNSGDYKVQCIDKYKTKGVTVWQTKKKQGGHFAYVMCVECNNRIGQWYGGEYKRLAEVCAPFVNPLNVGRIVSVTLLGLFPLRVFKQALTMLCATSDTEMNDEWEDILSPAASDLGVAKVDKDISLATNAIPLIGKYILDKEANGLPAPFQLYTCLVGNLAGRATGVVKMWSRSTGASALFVEFAWPPLGWVLIFDGSIKDKLFKVTNWSQYKYDEEVPVTLNLPCCWLESKMPLDFKTPAQMARSRARNQAIIDAREKQGRT